MKGTGKMVGRQDLEGYNSADEYDNVIRSKDAEDLIAKEKKFEKDLWKERGFVVMNPTFSNSSFSVAQNAQSRAHPRPALIYSPSPLS